MKRMKRKFSASFKTKVVLEVLKERKTVSEIASEFDVAPAQISLWKKEFLNNADSVFESSTQSHEKLKAIEQEKEELFKEVGRLNMENNWLKKKVL